MSRKILVLGTGRSGTSVIAGMLHAMGVSMGDEFMKSSPSNPHGTYEDVEFFQINRGIISEELNPMNFNLHGWFSDYMSRRDESDGELWGIKEPQLARTLHLWLSHLDDVKLVVVNRGKIATINSYAFAYHAKLYDAIKWYDREREMLDNVLESVEVPVLHINYDDIFDSPVDTAAALYEFVLDEDASTSRGSVAGVKHAAKHVRVDARKFDKDGKWIKRVGEPVDGWGKIAVGVRVGKFPEFDFFTSWTAMLTGGVRTGDKVLMPAGNMPAHWAANVLARDFLRSDCDSLLMIDDDMSFDMDAVNTIRDNVDNWEYDVVFGFCTVKSWPPKPVTLVLSEGDFDPPAHLLGEAYDRFTDFEDGDVFPVDAVGLAFTLIKRHVFEAMTGEYGPLNTFYFKYGPGLESDDIPFSRAVRELGFKMAVDTNVKIDHIGREHFGWKQYQLMRAQEKGPDVVEFNAKDLIPVLEEAIPRLEDNKKAAEVALALIGGRYEWN